MGENEGGTEDVPSFGWNKYIPKKNWRWKVEVGPLPPFQPAIHRRRGSSSRPSVATQPWNSPIGKSWYQPQPRSPLGWTSSLDQRLGLAIKHVTVNSCIKMSTYVNMGKRWTHRKKKKKNNSKGLIVLPKSGTVKIHHGGRIAKGFQDGIRHDDLVLNSTALRRICAWHGGQIAHGDLRRLCLARTAFATDHQGLSLPRQSTYISYQGHSRNPSVPCQAHFKIMEKRTEKPILNHFGIILRPDSSDLSASDDRLHLQWHRDEEAKCPDSCPSIWSSPVPRSVSSGSNVGSSALGSLRVHLFVDSHY